MDDLLALVFSYAFGVVSAVVYYRWPRKPKGKGDAALREYQKMKERRGA